MSPNTFRSSPASPSLSSGRCPLALSPSSHRRRPKVEFARGLLGNFSSTQMDLIESLFVTMGDLDPWGSIINAIWAAHLTDVEEAWDRATEPNPDLTSDEPPLYQTEAPLEVVLAPPQLIGSLVRVLVSPFSEEPPESVPVVTLPGDRRRVVLLEEEPSEGRCYLPCNCFSMELLS